MLEKRLGDSKTDRIERQDKRSVMKGENEDADISKADRPYRRLKFEIGKGSGMVNIACVPITQSAFLPRHVAK